MPFSFFFRIQGATPFDVALYHIPNAIVSPCDMGCEPHNLYCPRSLYLCSAHVSFQTSRQ